MGLDIFCLVTEWEPAVAAYRDAGGLDFYWDANVARNERFEAGDKDNGLPELSYLEEWELPGGRRSFMAAAEYYDFLRPHLPESIRGPADAAFGRVLPGYGFEDWLPDEDRNDLVIDSGVPRGDGLLYSMRPATVREINEIGIPWETLYDLSEQHPFPEEELAPRYVTSDHKSLHGWTLEWVARQHLNAVAAAAETGRGIIAVISY